MCNAQYSLALNDKFSNIHKVSWFAKGGTVQCTSSCIYLYTMEQYNDVCLVGNHPMPDIQGILGLN